MAVTMSEYVCVFENMQARVLCFEGMQNLGSVADLILCDENVRSKEVW